MSEQWNGYISENDGQWRLVVAGVTEDAAWTLLVNVESPAKHVERIVVQAGKPLPRRKKVRVRK